MKTDHLQSCYQAETGSRSNPITFWVCGLACPVAHPPKTHSPSFTGTLCGSKSKQYDTRPSCKRCCAIIKAAHKQARAAKETR